MLCSTVARRHARSRAASRAAAVSRLVVREEPPPPPILTLAASAVEKARREHNLARRMRLATVPAGAVAVVQHYAMLRKRGAAAREVALAPRLLGRRGSGRAGRGGKETLVSITRRAASVARMVYGVPRVVGEKRKQWGKRRRERENEAGGGTPDWPCFLVQRRVDCPHRQPPRTPAPLSRRRVTPTAVYRGVAP